MTRLSRRITFATAAPIAVLLVSGATSMAVRSAERADARVPVARDGRTWAVPLSSSPRTPDPAARPAALVVVPDAGAGLAPAVSVVLLAGLAFALYRERRTSERIDGLATHLARLQEELRRSERQARAGAAALELAHDLTTPIQNIGNSWRLLALTNDLSARETYAHTMERELVHVRNLLDSLRRTARTGSGSGPVAVGANADVNAVVRDVVASMEATACTAGVTLSADLTGAPRIAGDPFALARACQNLVANAVQATPAGGRVAVRSVERAGRAIVEVRDSGCGIAPDSLRGLLAHGGTTKQDGLGLGLPIAQTLARQMGGTLEAVSVPGAGSTFTLMVPCGGSRPVSSPAGAASAVRET